MTRRLKSVYVMKTYATQTSKISPQLLEQQHFRLLLQLEVCSIQIRLYLEKTHNYGEAASRIYIIQQAYTH